jgi:serine/threonine-protein kinase
MGEVWLAHQVSLDRKVALKLLAKHLAEFPGYIERFQREARSMAKLDHPNIVRVHAVGEAEGAHFVALDFIDGRTMQQWSDEIGQLSVGDALHAVLKCADGLKHAHDRQLIHRDVKPDNILVTKDGQVKVADFGLAKTVDDDLSMTKSGYGLGTPFYMAPEQARNAKHVDLRSDIYALGCTLYVLLTNNLPFAGNSAREVNDAKELGRFQPARRVNREVPERLDLMIDKMMAANPDHRYQDCDELMADLESLQLDNPRLGFLSDDTMTANRDRTAVTPPPSRVAPSRDSSGARTSSRDVETTPRPRKREKTPRPATRGLTSQTDAQTTESKRQPLADPKKTWFVQHKNTAGKVIISNMTTEQIQRALKRNLLDLRAKLKPSAKDAFLPLMQYREFEVLARTALGRSQVEATSTNLKEQFAQIDQEDRKRKKRRWIKRLTESTLGYFSLVIYLAVVVGIGYGLWVGIPILYRFVAAWLKVS